MIQEFTASILFW